MHAYATYNDGQLLALLRENDPAAFAEIYQRYWKPLFVITFKKVNDAQLAEELLQDLFLKLWERRAELNISVKLSTYLTAAVKYIVINALMSKRAAKNSHIILAEADQPILALTSEPGMVFSGSTSPAKTVNHGPGTFIQQNPLEGVFISAHGGHHGYDPNIPKMHTGFIATGAQIKKG